MTIGGIIEIENEQIPIIFSPDDLKPTFTTITNGETDEDFESRRNTFGRWAMGLPKKRKVVTQSFAGRAEHKPLSIMTDDPNHIQYFKKWFLHKDLMTIKRDFKIFYKENDVTKCDSFLGAFISSYSFSGKMEFIYDVRVAGQ